MNLVIFIILFVLLIAGLKFKLSNDILSPYNLLMFFWFAPFMFSFLTLSKYQTGLSFEAITIISVSTVILFSVVIIFQKSLADYGDSEKVDISILNRQLTPVVVLLFYSMCLIALYFAEFKGREFPLVSFILGSEQNSSLHRYGKDSKLQFLAAGISVAGAYCFSVFLCHRKKIVRILFFLLAFSVPLFGLLKASKSDIFIPFIYYSSIFYYLRGWKIKKFAIKFFIIFIVVALFLATVTEIRVRGVGYAKPVTYSDLIKYKNIAFLPLPVNNLISIVYGYACLNFQNFSNYVDVDDGRLRLGTSFFRPFYSIIMHGDIANELLVPKSKWNFVSRSATVGTFLRDLYMEGGAILCLIGSFIYSILVCLIYFKFKTKKNLVWLLIYANFMFPWIWLFFQNAFSVLTFYLNAFYIILIPIIVDVFTIKRARLS